MKLELLKLYIKALKMIPNSPNQLKVRGEIDKLLKEEQNQTEKGE